MSRAARILDELPPALPVFAILDGARDPRIRGWVFDTRAPRWCLYRGELSPALQDAAPWLLHLSRGSRHTEQFFERFWDRACGVLLSSAAQPKLLRRHLRRFLLARTEEGRVMTFRYYDPRVLRLYLPSCSPEETRTFFGPISAWAVETREPGCCHLFGNQDGALQHRVVSLLPSG